MPTVDQPNRGFEHEHAGVPVIAAFFDVGLSSGLVGFFYEGFDRQCLDCRVAAFLAMTGYLDVAVAGFGFVRSDAQDDDVALVGLGNGLLHSGGERRLLIGFEN